MKHTTGKWKLSKSSDNSFYKESTGSSFYISAIDIDGHDGAIMVFGEEKEERQANATLVAAAPELLEKCKTALGVLKHIYENHDTPALGIINGLEQAIKKATK